MLQDRLIMVGNDPEKQLEAQKEMLMQR